MDVIHTHLGAYFFRTIKLWMDNIYFLVTKLFKVLNGQINSNTFASGFFKIYSKQLIGKVILLLAYLSCVHTQTSWNWNTWKKILLKIIYSVVFSMFLWDLLNVTQFTFLIDKRVLTVVDSGFNHNFAKHPKQQKIHCLLKLAYFGNISWF